MKILEKNTQLLKESCELIVSLMRDIFRRLKIKDNSLKPCSIIEDDIMSDFLVGLNMTKIWHLMNLLNCYLICHCNQP